MTLGTLAFLVLIICASMFSLANASTFNQTFYLGEGEKKTLIVNLQAGQTVTGSLSVTGDPRHSYDRIYFSVIDPKEVILVDLGGVYNNMPKANFTFKALTEGKHKLIFDNGFGYAKYIELSYDVESGILPNLTNPENALLWIVLGAVIIGLILLGIGIYVSLRSKKNKPKPTT